MSLLDMIAKGGNNRYMDSFIEGRQAKQQYDINKINIDAAQAKAEMQKKRGEIVASADMTSDNPFIEISKKLAMMGDADGGKQYGDLGKLYMDLDSSQRKAALEKMASYNNDLTKSAQVIASSQNPVEAYQNERQVLSGLYPQLSQALPENPSAEEIKALVLPQIQRGLTAKEFLDQGKDGDVNTVQLLEPGSDSPRMGYFDKEQRKYFVYENGGVREADPQSQLFGRSRIQGSKGDVGLTKKNIGDLNNQILKDDIAIESLGKAITSIGNNPGAVGILGATRELFAGLSGQIPGVGKDIEKYLDPGGEITRTRTKLKLLVGPLVSRVTSDTSGRYSDQDMKRVNDALKALESAASATQAEIALNEILEVVKSGKAKAIKMLQEGPLPKSGGKSKFSNLWGD